MIKHLIFVFITFFSLTTFAQSTETPPVTESTAEAASMPETDNSPEAFLASLHFQSGKISLPKGLLLWICLQIFATCHLLMRKNY